MTHATLAPPRHDTPSVAISAVTADLGAELSEDELEAVVGGLARVLTPAPAMMPVQAAA